MYSLGVTLYEMLTKQLPFQTNDALELVHSHIAKIPVKPEELAPIPQVLSNIVMKLINQLLYLSVSICVYLWLKIS